MLKFIILAIMTFPLACTSQHELTGTWKSAKYSLWEKGIAHLKGTRGLLKEKELILHPDSTYYQTIQGIVNEGRWHTQHDSLFLISDTIIIPSKDSMSVLHPLAYKRNSGYTIRQNKLIQYHSGNYCRRRKGDGSIQYRDNFVMEKLKRSD